MTAFDPKQTYRFGRTHKHARSASGALTLLSAIRMKIRVDSVEYKCWHEVGHATVCLHLGGDLDGIEFLEGDARGFAVAHCCDIMPDMERSVACGGFAAEFYLLKKGYAEKGQDDGHLGRGVRVHERADRGARSCTRGHRRHSRAGVTPGRRRPCRCRHHPGLGSRR